MHAGVAQIEITPPVGLAMTGFIAREGVSTGIHDPLFAKSLVLDDGEQRAAIITCDLIGLHWAFVRQVRVAITAATGIPASHILIACSHTHAGPATLLLQDCGEIDEHYMAQLHNLLVSVTQSANHNRQPATFAVGHGTVTDHVHNRRTPGDVIDPDLGVLRIVDAAGKALAIVLNYACHPTTLEAGNRLFSAEYPGYATNKVQSATGAITLFITGAIGDVGPQTRGWEPLRAIGEAISGEALRVLNTIDHERNKVSEKVKLVATAEAISLPLLPAPSLAWWEQEVRKWQEMKIAPDVPLLPSHPKIPVAMRHWSSRMCDLANSGKLPTQVTTEIQVIRFGDLAFVSAPGELFVELGLAIKAATKAHVFLCGFGNDDVGYIPARRAYPKGGYEINEAYKYYGYSTALAAEAGEEFVAKVIELLG